MVNLTLIAVLLNIRFRSEWLIWTPIITVAILGGAIGAILSKWFKKSSIMNKERDFMLWRHEFT